MAALNMITGLARHREQNCKSVIPLMILIAISLFGRMAVAQYGGGTGTPDDPYLIYTAEQLNAIGADSQNMDKHFKLMADIDLSGYTRTDFNMIGGTSYAQRFSGLFDGNGRKIHNFTYTSTNRDYIGFFGYVGGENALIKNLGLIDARVEAGTGKHVGLLAGNLRVGTIRGCYVRGGSVSGEKYVGGLIGRSFQSTITDSYAIVSVSGRSEVGGLVGMNEDHALPFGPVSTNRISNCCATGTVSARIDAGGLVGQNWDGTIVNSYSTGSVSDENGWCLGGLVGRYFGGTIVNCYSTGDVSGNFEVGGLVGDCRDGTITNCYSTGAVTGTLEVGGLVGSNSTGTVTACFWDRQRSGLSNMCGEQESGTGCDDGNGRKTAQMQTADTFLEAGWDFVRENDNGTEDVWTICEGLNYPQFTWQFITGDFDGDFWVDFTDFAFFAERWLVSDISFVPCRGADLTGDGQVGFDDLREFAGNWLNGGIPIPTAVVCLVIDDFESYNDLDPSDPASNRIFDVWLDGYNDPLTNGCTIGHFFPPYAERDIVYEGEQSMPFYYNALFKVGTAERMLNPPQNWAGTGAEVLSIWFHGDSINGVTPMSVVLNGDTRIYHDEPEATRINAWTEWIVDLKAFEEVDLTSVRSIAICLGDPSRLQAGGTGLMFFDYIRLFGPG